MSLIDKNTIKRIIREELARVINESEQAILQETKPIKDLGNDLIKSKDIFTSGLGAAFVELASAMEKREADAVPEDLKKVKESFDLVFSSFQGAWGTQSITEKGGV